MKTIFYLSIEDLEKVLEKAKRGEKYNSGVGHLAFELEDRVLSDGANIRKLIIRQPCHYAECYPTTLFDERL